MTLKFFSEKSTFTQQIAYPGLLVLFVLSLLCAFFPTWTGTTSST